MSSTDSLQGDGVTDDTAAINKAISDGGRCGAECGSSTIYPAFIYFPSGTYLVSSPIIQYYNTEFYGNVCHHSQKDFFHHALAHLFGSHLTTQPFWRRQVLLALVL
jgi:hypothetical protein